MIRATASLFRKFVCEEDGLETVEYAIIAGLIVAGAIATIVAIGGLVAAKFAALEKALGGGT